MFRALGHFTYRRRLPLLVAGAIFLLLGAVATPGLFPVLSNGGYDNPTAESSEVSRILQQRFEGGQDSLVVLMSARDGATVDSPTFSAAAHELLERVAKQPGVASVRDFYSTGAAQFVAADKRSTFAVVQLKPDAAPPTVIQALREQFRGATLEALLGGVPAINVDVLTQVRSDLARAESMALPVVAVLLLFVFGSVVAASLPLAMGALSILGAFLMLRLLVHVTPISIFALNVVSMLGMGLAIDYSLFIVSRFREELARGKTVEAALVRTLQTAGHTVLFSGLTVTLSMLSLLLFPQMLMHSISVGGSVGVLLAMIGSLTVLPALLAVLGPKVNALPVGRRARVEAEGAHEHGFWYRLSHVVMRWPLTVLVVVLVPLLLAGAPFLHVHFSMPDERNIPSGLESRTVAERMRASFGDNELAPVQLLVRFGTKGPVESESLGALYDWVQQVKAVPGVVRVDSLVSLAPRLDAQGKEGYQQFYDMVQSGLMPKGKPAVDHFSNGPYTLVQAYFKGDTRGDASRERVRQLRALAPPADARVQVGGESAELVDLLEDMGRIVPRAVAVIVVTIFVLLFLMLGSLVVPLKAVILNFLSLTVSFGALVWIFQDGHLSGPLGVQPTGSIDALEPIIVFVIAFGLSMDYEVFLLSRIQESFLQTRDNTRSVALGIQRTGGIITNAALLLGVVILGFAAGKVLSLKQVGVGLFLAILVDATLVRSLLVPATMRLLGNVNWWAPAPLRWLYEKLGLGHIEAEEPPAQGP